MIAPEEIETGVTVWSKRFGLFLAGWFLSSAWHGNIELTQKAQKLEVIQKVEIPKLKGALHCEHVRGDKAAAVAGQAILSNSIDAVPSPQLKDVPLDNCPPAAAVK